jgi:4a-hydroxytetrahydrobiopterin dehydratase
MMSEQGWREFLEADGVEDWVVLHGGPTAVFRTESMTAAARLAVAVADVPGLDTDRAALSVTARGLGVRLTREVWAIEAEHIEVARAISAVAREHGASADRAAVQEVQIAVAAKPADLDVGFWRAVLGYDAKAPDNGIDPLGHGSTFWVQDLPEEKPLRHAMHIDVSVAREHARARLEAALAAGGRIVDDSEAPSTWILADRANNKVCIAAWPDGARPSTPTEGDTDGSG